jgi:hypothetical protein
VTFLWSSVVGASAYRIYASVDGAPVYSVAEVSGSENSVTASVQPGTVTWFVEAVFKGCPSTNSPRARFTIAKANICPTEKPQLLTPANNSQNVQPPVTFSWTPISGETKYVLFIKTDTGVPTAVGETVGNSLERPVPVGATIEWWVVAFVPGCTGIEADHFFFSVPAPPTCDGRGTVLVTPVEGSIETTSPVRFSWTPVAKAAAYQLYISTQNGLSLAYAGQATEATVNLPGGLTKWYVSTIYRDCPAVDSAVSSFTLNVAQTNICGSPEQCAGDC